MPQVPAERKFSLPGEGRHVGSFIHPDSRRYRFFHCEGLAELCIFSSDAGRC